MAKAEYCAYSKCSYYARLINLAKDSTHILKKHDGKSYHSVCLIKKLAEGAK